MEFKFILGIDMSKEWFHYCLMSKTFEIICEGKNDNHPDAIFQFITKLLKREEVKSMEEIFMVLEHTGIYVQHLVNGWLSKSGALSIVPATKVSELLGGQLGWEEKTDKLDARRLAEYGIRYEDKLQPWEAKVHTLELLQRLQRQRSRQIDVINILEVPLKESLEFDTAAISEELSNNQSASLTILKNDLKKIEKQLQTLIDDDPLLKQLFKLITSVDGVGPVTAREVIITTCAFTKFTPEQAKSYARYSGVVTRKKSSGKMRKKDRIPKRANKKIKTLLTMGATSLIGTHSDLGLFYERKIQEGKAHFSVVNAMRNKLILRIFAVVRNQVIYDKNLNLIID